MADVEFWHKVADERAAEITRLRAALDKSHARFRDAKMMALAEIEKAFSNATTLFAAVPSPIVVTEDDKHCLITKLQPTEGEQTWLVVIGVLNKLAGRVARIKPDSSPEHEPPPITLPALRNIGDVVAEAYAMGFQAGKNAGFAALDEQQAPAFTTILSAIARNLETQRPPTREEIFRAMHIIADIERPIRSDPHPIVSKVDKVIPDH